MSPPVLFACQRHTHTHTGKVLAPAPAPEPLLLNHPKTETFFWLLVPCDAVQISRETDSDFSLAGCCLVYSPWTFYLKKKALWSRSDIGGYVAAPEHRQDRLSFCLNNGSNIRTLLQRVIIDEKYQFSKDETYFSRFLSYKDLTSCATWRNSIWFVYYYYIRTLDQSTTA